MIGSRGEWAADGRVGDWRMADGRVGDCRAAVPKVGRDRRGRRSFGSSRLAGRMRRSQARLNRWSLLLRRSSQ